MYMTSFRLNVGLVLEVLVEDIVERSSLCSRTISVNLDGTYGGYCLTSMESVDMIDDAGHDVDNSCSTIISSNPIHHRTQRCRTSVMLSLIMILLHTRVCPQAHACEYSPQDRRFRRPPPSYEVPNR